MFKTIVLAAIAATAFASPRDRFSLRKARTLATPAHDLKAARNMFATGMNGDEDLGEDITMKGDKFHY